MICLRCRSAIQGEVVHVALSNWLVAPGNRVFINHESLSPALLCATCSELPIAITHLFELARHGAGRAKGAARV